MIASTTAMAISLTWAGIEYPWSSWHVLVPLCLGLVGLIMFFVYEWKLAKRPLVSPVVFSRD